MKKSKLLLGLLALVIGVPLLGGAVVLATFDANAYRGPIAETLGKKLGRTVKLEGPLHVGVSWQQGVTLEISDVSLSNPAWARQSVMAKIGHAGLGVGIRPLLERRLEISSFTLEDADIHLETNAAEKGNWEFADANPKVVPVPEPAPTASASVALQIELVTIRNSRLSLRDKSGKTTAAVVQDLTLTTKKDALTLAFDGVLNGTPLKLNVTGGDLERLQHGVWPFAADIASAPYSVQVNGEANLEAKKATLSSYALTAGSSKITGALTAAWGGVRPVVQGTVNSDHLDPADLKPAAKGEVSAEGKTATPSSNTDHRLFSAEPLNLDGLKAVDAKLDVALADVTVGPSTLKGLETKLDLAKGRLLLSPFRAMLAGSKIEGQVMVDASATPSRMSVMLKGRQLELSQLAHVGGMESLIAGKGDMDLDITSSGASLHDLASNANGQINLVAAGGTMSEQVLGEIASGLLDAFLPGKGALMKPEMNCLAARFNIVNGVMQSNGILVDMAQATVAGAGAISLRDETINMLLHTKPKGLDVSKFAPPLRISGPLTGPHFAPDAVGSVEKLAGAFLKIPASESGVPDMIAQNGKNACLATLESPPKTNSPTQKGLLQDGVGKAREKLNDVGGKLLQNLFK